MITEKLETYINALATDEALALKNVLTEVEKFAVESPSSAPLLSIVADEISADSITVAAAAAYAYIPYNQLNTVIDSGILVD